MPDALTTKQAIASALAGFGTQPLAAAAATLWGSLGYRSEKRFAIKPNTAAGFVDQFGKDKPLNPEYAMLDDWQSVDFLFQLTDDEIRDAATGTASFAFESKGKYDGAAMESYLFFAVTLKKPRYTRTELAGVTRAVNRLFPMPVMLMFRHGDTITLALINRRLHKRDEAKDVLEKVTLIKDIRFANPHRAHIEILYDLSFDALRENHEFTNFVQLHEAWRKTLDSSELNKRFFLEVANWYFWTLHHAEFPKDAPKQDGKDHISVIRLITRLMFCWFIKEKGLIPDTLFDERKLPQILTGFAPGKVSDKESVFYKAILQNLFFATLNTEMDKRGWTKDEQNFMAHSLYRHRELFQKPADALDLFKNIPFLNGGLFECLDKDLGENAKPRYVRIDGFSRREDSQPVVPDFLFFGPEREVDLSEEYDDARFQCVKVRGLIRTFEHYKFTVAENTPIEEEIALDPELSGKVFENLLAAYNPETKATARKQTGSFYTPREVVNYMVDEALIACLKTKLETALPSAKDVEARLRHLFAYNDEPHKFTTAEVDTLIAAIDSLRTLDPAVGSGAFPMGILHKLVFILAKLDPQNEKWKERQRQRAIRETAEAFKIGDKEERQHRLDDINEVFEQNASDYGRKLYLIENCIYGVDIQPIAVQIAKMRFFISLVADQKVDDAQPNRGVRPLPNLETKFVAANSLIGITRPGQQMLRNREIAPKIEAKEAELHRVRERHFLARSLSAKRKCRELDAKLRAEIADLLKNDGWDTGTAQKLAAWNPYDQNASAGFFDPEWMFGILNGFDVAIANPPYGANIDALLPVLRPRFQPVIQNYADSFKMFYQLGLELAAPKGILAYISPNVFLSQPRYKDMRKYLLRYRIERLVNLGEGVFDQIVPVCLSFISNEDAGTSYEFADLTEGNKFTGDFAEVRYNEVSTKLVASFKDLSLYSGDALKAGQVYFADALEIKDAGIQYHRSGIGLKNKGGNDLYERLFASSPRQFSKSKPVWYGRLIDRYWMRDQTDEFFNLDYETILKDNESASFTRAAFSISPKILWRQTASCLQATIDHDGRWFRNTIQCAYVKPEYKSRIDPHYLLGVVNSKYIAYAYNKLVREAGRVFPQVKITHVKKLPLAVPSKPEQDNIADTVKKILSAKRANPAANTSKLEREIDEAVYALYGLTPEEIKIVEESVNQ